MALRWQTLISEKPPGWRTEESRLDAEFTRLVTPLLNQTARYVRRDLRARKSSLTLADLMAVGLVEAFRHRATFDPAKKGTATIEKWIRYRAQSAMVEEVRRQGTDIYVPRQRPERTKRKKSKAAPRAIVMSQDARANPEAWLTQVAGLVGGSPEEAVAAEQDRTRLREAVEQLQHDQREIIAVLFGLDGGGGDKVRTLARRLGVTRSAVERRRDEALAELRKALDAP